MPKSQEITNCQSDAHELQMSRGHDDHRSLKIEWLTTEEAASYLRLSVGSLRNLTSNGCVPHHKLGRRNRYRLDDLRTLLLNEKRGVTYD